MAEMPYDDNPGQTHYDGCWADRGHHNCAVRLVAKLQRENAAMREELDQVNREPACNCHTKQHAQSKAEGKQEGLMELRECIELLMPDSMLTIVTNLIDRRLAEVDRD